MSEQPKHKDLICAFLDEELSAAEVDELLSQLECQDARARACRQSLAASLLTTGRQRTVCPDLAAGVRQALAQEVAAAKTPPTVVPLRAARRPGNDWKVPATGLALAASMAMVAVFVIKPSQPFDDGESRAQVASATAAQPVAQTVGANVVTTRELVIATPEKSRPLVAQWGSADVPAGTQPVSSSAALQRQQLNTFLINHARNGGGSALSGSLGYARVAASPQQQSEESRR